MYHSLSPSRRVRIDGPSPRNPSSRNPLPDYPSAPYPSAPSPTEPSRSFTMAQHATSATKTKGEFHRYSQLAPRFWHGMTLSPWLRLLARNRFAISPTRIPLAAAVTFFATMNSGLHAAQELVYRRRAEQVELKHPPVFIIGHWRSGTTLLHELMVLDPRLTYPTTFQCFAPNHFLVSKKVLTPVLKLLLPKHRPMDNMPAGWDRPQEDEFAMMNLGLPSPYLSMAFPNREPAYPEYLDLSDLSEEEERAWKDGMLWFLKRVALRDDHQVVLKSPPHTARVRTLLEMFPDARFVHLVRDPSSLFPSTVRLWRSLHEVQGLQVAKNKGLEEQVLSTFERMYKRFEADRELLSPSRLYELRYEDLVRDPVKQLRAIYEQLELGDFETAAPYVEEYLEGSKDYRTNRHELPDETRELIRSRWGKYMERYGYDFEPDSGSKAENKALSSKN